MDDATARPSRLTRMAEATVAVNAGDIVLCGMSYFHVNDVHEPSHPGVGGMGWPRDTMT